MRYFLVVFIGLLLMFGCDEQMLEHCSVEKVETVADGSFYTMPQFSPDGRAILFSGVKGRGLFFLTIEDGKRHNLSAHLGEGYSASFSPDGSYIATSVQAGSLGFAVLYSVADRVQVWRSEREGRIAPPVWSSNLPLWFNRSRQQLVAQPLQMRGVQQDKEQLLTWTEMNTIMVSRNGKISKLTDGYASQISPDGSKLLFKRSGSIYIYDFNTKNEQKIARGDHPSWSPDSNSLLFIQTTDNGEKILTSRLFSVGVDGNNQKEIDIFGNSIVLYPSWNPNKNAILFADDNDGSIKIANISEGGCK
ncbi:PD40 domain-containing protein [bacterium]|nr:PD40 domain-containing protein [bacterium]